MKRGLVLVFLFLSVHPGVRRCRKLTVMRKWCGRARESIRAAAAQRDAQRSRQREEGGYLQPADRRERDTETFFGCADFKLLFEGVFDQQL